jgi:hypothetical protein
MCFTVHTHKDGTLKNETPKQLDLGNIDADFIFVLSYFRKRSCI